MTTAPPEAGAETGQQDDGQGQQQQQAPAGKTYSQEDVDRVVRDRLARAEAKYADYNDLKKRAGEYDKLVESSKTDQQRAVEQARKEGESEALKRANSRVITAEARALAAAKQFRDPTDAVAFLRAGGALDSIKISDEGDVDTKALEAALDDLAKTKAYLLNEEKNPRPAGDAGQGPRQGAGIQSMNEIIHGLATKGRQ
jgi:hypothetical protein